MNRLLQSRAVVPVAVFVGVFILYTLTLTGVHTFDAYSYAAAVQTKPWRETFHPHHLLYGPLGAAAYQFSQIIGYRGTALLPLQLINVHAGAFGVTLWVVLLRWRTGRTDLALLGGGLLATAYAWWYYAVEVEVYTLAALFLIAGSALLLLLLDNPLWRRGWIWLGLAHSGAILFHQTNVLWTVPLLLGWSLARWPGATPWTTRLRLLGGYILTSLLVVGGGYAVVMFGLSGFRSWPQVRAWLFEYAETGFWGGPLSGDTVRRLGEGWRLTLTGAGGGLMLLAFLAIVGLAAPQLRRRWWRETALAVTWIAVYTLFFGWWEADNIEFWIAVLPPLILLVVLALSCYAGWRRSAALALTWAVVGVLLVQNGRDIMRRGDRASDVDRQVVTMLAAVGAPEDLYLVPNGLQELYLRHEFDRPNVLALSLGVGDWDAGCALMQAAIVNTTAAGYAVWMDDAVLNPPAALLERYRLDGAAVRTCFAPFTTPTQRTIGATTYNVLNPTPQGEPDWRWRDWTLGWKANFITATRWENGWSFIPGADPHLLSPPLRLNTAEWSSIKITMATSLPDQHGQLYWIAPGGAAAEARSLIWDVIPDGAMHTYVLSLRDQPAWSGTLGLLRIDPVIAGDGRGRVTLERVRLLP
jgi:hypothetical protein